MTTPLDEPARVTIREELARTLFVEAGAGSGKTAALVARVVNTVLDPTESVPLRHIAAVTFTEKAAAELRDRLRRSFEKDGSAASQQALDELDSAAIGTLHAFARRILSEHPIEAGLPPLIEVLDEVASGVAFDERYENLRTELLDDRALSPALLLALAAGLRLSDRQDDLRSIARTFTDNWDLIRARVLDTPAPPLPTVDIVPLVQAGQQLADLRDHCRDATDKLLPHLELVAAWTQRLAGAVDDPARVAVLRGGLPHTWGRVGRKENWGCPIDEVRAQGQALVKAAADLRQRVLDAALRTLAHRVGEATLADARVRREEGRLEFHDLLVLTRDLLRHPGHGKAVRTALQHRYRRLLLDEFQDTDPIQIELAVRIAGGAKATAADWTKVTVPPASLFVVGDPKQSIYRFRRADIGMYLTARQTLGETVVLDTNFRTGKSIVDWINHTFGQLITAQPGSQPEFHPLRSWRPDAPVGPSVVRLGHEIHDSGLTAAQLRAAEAADVVAAVRTALAQRWQVQERDGTWRDVRLPDIAVLLPTRTSLPQLEAALDEAGIGYHSESSSLVYRTGEVRELLAAARAVDDPSDQLSLVTALRSRLFGCGDDDLWQYKQAAGTLHLLRPRPDGVSPEHPVAEGLEFLRRLHYDSAWCSPSEVLTRIVEGRRMLEVAVGDGHARDVWRRLRFVVDQARAWAESEHGGLRDYLSWVARQGSDTARVAEAVLPETDTQSLRIMTIHASKGMEFPVVIIAGLTTQPGGRRGGVEVLWPPRGGYEVKLGADLTTAAYDAAAPIDEQMDEHERIRLLYVACTRARDHLVVSLHRKAPRSSSWKQEERRLTNAELLAQASVGAPGMIDLEPVEQAPVLPAPRPVPAPPDRPQWADELAAVRRRTAWKSSVSASQFEGTAAPAAPTHAVPIQAVPAAVDALGEPRDPGLAKDPRDLELPPWNKGRYGTAVGRAVHAVLQTVELATGAALAGAVAAQVLAEGVTEYADVVTQLVRAALGAEVIDRAASRPHWRETYVGTVENGQVVEGIVDLLYRDDDGLVIVDYKTDAVPASAIPARVQFYRPQMDVYATAIEAAVGEPVRRCVLLFLNPAGAYAAVAPR